MSSEDSDKLDRLIESALRPDPIRSVPPGFFLRTEEKLRIAALVERERRYFRNCFLAAVCVAAGISSAGVIAAYLGGVPGTIMTEVPGIMGLFDRGAVVLRVWWPGLAGGGAITFCMAGLMALLAECRGLYFNALRSLP